MINRANPLPITQQCRILDLCRSSVYYKPVPLADRELALMRRIDEIDLKVPFYGNRRIRDQLEREGCRVDRKKVRRLMLLMGISALYPRRRTSKPGKGHKVEGSDGAEENQGCPGVPGQWRKGRGARRTAETPPGSSR